MRLILVWGCYFMVIKCIFFFFNLWKDKKGVNKKIKKIKWIDFDV